MQRLKVHPDLAFATLRGKCDRAYRLWLLCRALDERGRGLVSLGDLRTFLDAHQVRGLAPGTLRRLINASDGVFWTVHRGSVDNDGTWLQLCGLATVCKNLGMDKLRKSPVYVPMRFGKTLKAFRASLLAAYFAADEYSNPISRGVLEKLTGATGRTQRRWQALLCNTLVSRQNACPTTYPWERGDEVPDGHFVDLIDNEATLLKRLPNSYRCRLQVAPRGNTRKVNSRLLTQSPVCLCEVGQEKRDRLFYHERQPAQRRMHACTEGDTFFLIDSPSTTARGGALLWNRFRVANGGLFCG